MNVSKIMTSVFGGVLVSNNSSIISKVRNWELENINKPSFKKSIYRRIYLIAIFFAFSKYIYNAVLYLKNKTKILEKFTDSYHLDDKIHFPPDALEKMTNFEARIGLLQLLRYNNIIDHRVSVANKYFNHLKAQQF